VLELATEPIYELIRTDQLRSRKAGSRRIIGNHLLSSSMTVAAGQEAG